jgi:hypothetical protein
MQIDTHDLADQMISSFYIEHDIIEHTTIVVNGKSILNERTLLNRRSKRQAMSETTPKLVNSTTCGLHVQGKSYSFDPSRMSAQASS